MTEFIGIVSGKGGVGKTTTAINLATELTNFGKKIILVDGDLTNSNILLHLGIPTNAKTLHDAINGKCRIHDAVYHHNSGINVIPGSIKFEDSCDINHYKFMQLLPLLKGYGEAVIVDSSPGLGQDTKAVLKSVDKVIVVTTPSLVSVTDAKKSIMLAKSYGKRVLGAVVTKVSDSFWQMPLSNIQTMLEVPILAAIPNDYNVDNSIHLKHPLVDVFPESPATKEYRLLASRLIGEHYRDNISRFPEIHEIDKKGVAGHILDRCRKTIGNINNIKAKTKYYKYFGNG